MPDEREIKEIRLLRDGDRQAFDRLYARYWSRVLGFAKLYIRDEEEQKEIVQQVFIRLWEIRRRLSAEQGIDGLLFIITRNIIFNQKHRSANEQALQQALSLEGSDVLYDLEARIDSADLLSYVDELIEALPVRQRQAFRLSRRDGLSNKEIAQVMGISSEGVKRHIHLALKFIRENLPLFLLFLGVVDR